MALTKHIHHVHQPNQMHAHVIMHNLPHCIQWQSHEFIFLGGGGEANIYIYIVYMKSKIVIYNTS